MAYDRDTNLHRVFYQDAGAWISHYNDTNHDWVAYKADGITPANGFYYPKRNYYDINDKLVNGTFWYAPVDISRTDVRDFLWNNTIAPAIKLRKFDGVALDNVTSYNAWGRVGFYKNNSFAPRYTGARIDPAFTKDVADYLTSITQKANKQGLCVAINNTYYSLDVKSFLVAANAVDIDVDETGFTKHVSSANTVMDETGSNIPPSRSLPCNPTPKFFNVTAKKGTNWTDRMLALKTLAQNPNKALVILDKTCIYKPNVTSALIEGPLANYLLIKGPRTYLAISSELLDTTESSYFDFPELYWPIGLPLEDMQTDGIVYWRHFQNALAVVNPTDQASTFDLQGQNYTGMDGGIRSGIQTLASGSALFLVPRFFDGPWKTTNSVLQQAADGKSFRLLVSKDTVASNHAAVQVTNVDASAAWQFSFEFRAAGINYVRGVLKSGSNTASIVCDTGALAPATWVGGTGVVSGSSVLKTSEGWVRCTLSGTASPGSKGENLTVGLIMAVKGTSGFIGNGSDGVDIRNLSLVPQ